MNFTLLDNQHGTFLVSAVDASGATAPLPSDLALVSTNTAVLTVAFDNGNAAGTYIVTAVAAGDSAIIASSASGNISTTFSFQITGGPAVGFVATLTGVSNN